MKYSCIPLGAPNVQEHLAFLEKELNYDFTPKQLVTIWNRWVDNDVTKLEGLPTVANIVETYTKIENTTADQKFLNENISDKTDIVDYLQHLYFQGIASLSKSPVITREIIREYQSVVFEKMPSILRKKGLESIADNFDKYKEYLVKQRLQKFNVPEEIDETETVKDGISNNSSVFSDVFNSGSDEAKFLIASLKSDKDNNGVPRPVNFTEVKNILQNYLGNSLNFVDQANKLVELKEKYYWANELLEKLGITDTNDFMPEGIYGSVRTSFSESFSKQLVDISVTSVGGKDSFSAIDNKQKLDIKEKAQTKFWSSSNSKVIGGNRVLNAIKYKTQEFSLSEKDLKDFVAFFGITLDPSIELTPELKADIIQIKKAIEKAIKENKDIEWIDDKFLDVSSRVQNILQAQVPFEKEAKQLSVNNAEGKQQNAVSNHNYFSRTVSRLEQGLKEAKNAFEKLFSETKAILTIISGAQFGETNEKDSSTFNKLSITDILTTQFTDMFSNKPVIHLPRSADKAMERGFTITDTKDLNKLLAYTTISDKVITDLYKAFESDKAQTFHPDWKYADDSSPLSFWEALGCTSTTTREQFTTIIKDKIQSLQKETYQMLEKNKLFVKSDGGLKVLFSNAALLKMGWNDVPAGANKENYQRGLLLKLIDNYNFNNLYFGILNTQTLQGSLSGINPNNFFKRTAGPVAESRTPRVDNLIVEELNAEMRQLGLTTFDASKLLVQIHSKTVNPTTDKDILAISKEYSKNDEDDAQGIMVFPMYKAILKMSSQWSDNQEKAYKKIMKGEKLSDNEKGLFPPIKPVGFSVVDKDGYKIPIYIKTAVYPMSPADVVGTANEEKYRISIEKGIGLWIPSSGIKMATPTKLKSVPEGANEDAMISFPMADFGIQLDISAKESTKQLIGTQQRKLKWSNLFEAGKAISTKFKKLLQEDRDNIQAMSDMQREKLYKEMGIEEIDGDISIKNFNKFKELIKNELISRENPINTIEAIDDIIDEDGNVILTMDSVPARQKIMNMLNAIINNRIIKQYTNGSALVQVSQQGWQMPEGSTLETKTSIEFTSDEAKQNYIDNKGLSFFKIDTTTGSAECLLPAKFKKYVNADGTIDPKLLISIGYRIPTQGHNSMLHLKVIGFLPAHLDQMIVLPKEITTQSGSDFDVDKINIFVPNTINIKGETKYLDSNLDLEKLFEEKLEGFKKFKKYLDAGLQRVKTDIEDSINNSDEAAQKLLTAIFGAKGADADLSQEDIEDILVENGFAKDELEKVIAKIQKYSTEEYKQNWILKNKEKQLQNKNIEITVQLLENEEVVKSLITPNSPGKLKEKSEEISKKLTDTKNPLRNLKIELSNMFNGITLAKITSQMFASKALVGIFASQSTHHSLSQQVGLHFKTTKRPFYFDHNKIEIKGEKYSNLSAIFNKAGELISDILGNNYLTAAVDSAKDDYLTELGVNLETGSSVALFERLGGNRDYMVAWFNQPIIQEYLRLSKYYKSLSYKAISKKTKTKTEIIEEVAKQFNLGTDNLGYLLERKSWQSNKLNKINADRQAAGEYDVKDLETNWFSGSVSSRVNQLEMIKNLFDDFLYFEDATSVLSKSISTTKFDTSGPGKDIVQSEQLKIDYINFNNQMNGEDGFTLGTIENDNVAPYERLVTDTLLNTFYNNSWKFVIPLYKPILMLYRNSNINSALLNLINGNNSMVVKKATMQEANDIYGGLINYVLQNSRGINRNLFFNETGKEETDFTVGKTIIDIQNDPKHILNNNAVIQDLFNVKRSSNSKIPTLLIPRYRSYSVDDSTTFTMAFEEIKQLDPNLYEDLLTVSLFQTGVVQSPSSFYNLIPHKDTAAIFDKALKGMDATTMDYATGIMENIGNKLTNLKTMSFDEILSLPKLVVLSDNKAKATEGFDFIKFYAVEDSAVYKKVEYGKYIRLDKNNLANLFYDYTAMSENTDTGSVDTGNTENYDDNRPSDDEIADMQANQPQVTVTQRTFKDEELHQAYIKGGLEAVTKLIRESKKKELDAAKQLSKEVDMLEEFEQLNFKLNKTNSENDKLIELYTILKNSKELDFEYSLNELGLTTQPQVTQDLIVREYTPENITSLKPNEVFVFGSNTEGRHGKGAALTAKQKFGAIQGQAGGLQGQSYAIITKDLAKGEKSIPLKYSVRNTKSIEDGIERFLYFARQNPNTKFYVTKLGSSLAGYSVEEIKNLFKNSLNVIPNNVILPKEYEVREQVELKTKQDAWSKLSLEQMTNLGKKGITKELFNNSSAEEQEKTIKCHG